MWDSAAGAFRGVISIADIIDILRISFRSASKGASVKATFDTLTVGVWFRMRASLSTSIPLYSLPRGPPGKLLAVDPEDHLMHISTRLRINHAHFIPVLDVEQNAVIGTLTHRALLSGLLQRFADAERLFCQPLCALGIGTYDENILVVPDYTALIAVLALLIERRLTGLPVVNAAGQVVDLWLAEEVAFLANDPTFACLDASVSDLRAARNQLVRYASPPPNPSPPPPPLNLN